MDNAGPKAIFLHCLPSFHDLKTKIGHEMGMRFNVSELEVTDEVFEQFLSCMKEHGAMPGYSWTWPT